VEQSEINLNATQQSGLVRDGNEVLATGRIVSTQGKQGNDTLTVDAVNDVCETSLLHHSRRNFFSPTPQRQPERTILFVICK